VSVTVAANSPDDTRNPPAASGAPFDLPGGPDAVLLLHGLTGSPYEMRHVAERLHRRGYRALGPVMPGHGGDPRRLVGLSWRAWVEGARHELRRLDGARQVFVVGCSMGALVACVLAHSEPGRIRGLALLAPALHLGRSAAIAAFLARTPVVRAWPLVPKLGGSDVRDALQRRINPTMAAVPLAAVGELAALSRHVARLLPEISAPALVVAGRHDHTVRFSGARALARRIGSAPAALVVLERSFHLVGIDVDRDRCADEVATFIERTAVPGGRAPGGESWART
jgi:carboxylesterase